MATRRWFPTLMLFSLLAAPMVTAQETSYGPFSVTPGAWVGTGIHLEKGQSFRVEAGGTWRFLEGTKEEFGPNGGGYGNRYVLKGKIGDRLRDLGARGSDTAEEAGQLELGAPYGYTMGPNEGMNAVIGTYVVTVFVQGPVGGDDGGGLGEDDGADDEGADDGETDANDLDAYTYWCADELVAGAEPSQPCTICIGDWMLTTAGGGNMVVEFPLNTSSWGDQATGPRVFAGGFPNSDPNNPENDAEPISRWEGAVWDWGGYTCSVEEIPFTREYPWGFFISAPLGAPLGFAPVPIVVRQVGGGSVGLNLQVEIVAGGGWGGAGAGTFARIQNRWRPTDYLNIESGGLTSSPIQNAWWSAMWELEPVAGTDFVRLKNRWKPDQYVNLTESGALESGAVPAHWWSSMWRLEPMAGTDFVRLKNRWKPDQYLHVTENGALKSGAVPAHWWSSMWALTTSDASSGGQTGGADLVPLKLFWNGARGDNFTTATDQGEQDARAAGYTLARVEGQVFRTQQAGTVPLKLYWSSPRQDNYTTGTSGGEAQANAARYVFTRIEGYVYPTQQPGTVPLKLFWSQQRGDNFVTATEEGERDARNAGYSFGGIEGYVVPMP